MDRASQRRAKQVHKKLYNAWDPTWQTTPEGLPFCPQHNVPMHKMFGLGHMHSVDLQETNEEGDTFTVGYVCRGKPGNDSPGWTR